MLISRKVTKDKGAVTDFRHLNIRISKNNLAYPLLKHTFSALGSSRYNILSALDLKDAFYSYDFQRIQKDIVGFYHILVAFYTYIKECLWN